MNVMPSVAVSKLMSVKVRVSAPAALALPFTVIVPLYFLPLPSTITFTPSF